MTRPRDEYIHSLFLIFVEYMDNPGNILDDIVPRRRKYTYLISIRILPKDKFIRLTRGDIYEVECEVRFSNIGHVRGTDVNILSQSNYFPQPTAAFLNCFITQSPNQIGLKYCYKFDKEKYLDDDLYWQGIGGKLKTQIQFPMSPGVHPREHVQIEKMYDGF